MGEGLSNTVRPGKKWSGPRAVPSVLQRKARLGLSAGFIHPMRLRGWFHQGWDFFFFFFLRQVECLLKASEG